MRIKPLQQSYGYPTVRKHPRSLAEAFPEEHACAIALYQSERSWLAADVAIAIIALAVVVCVLIGIV